MRQVGIVFGADSGFTRLIDTRIGAWLDEVLPQLRAACEAPVPA